MKTNSELLKEIQNTVDVMNEKKEEVELLLKIIDNLEVKYHTLSEEMKNNK